MAAGAVGLKVLDHIVIGIISIIVLAVRVYPAL
jgi:hypothetical protein